MAAVSRRTATAALAVSVFTLAAGAGFVAGQVNQQQPAPVSVYSSEPYTSPRESALFAHQSWLDPSAVWTTFAVHVQPCADVNPAPGQRRVPVYDVYSGGGDVMDWGACVPLSDEQLEKMRLVSGTDVLGSRGADVLIRIGPDLVKLMRHYDAGPVAGTPVGALVDGFAIAGYRGGADSDGAVFVEGS